MRKILRALYHRIAPARVKKLVARSRMRASWAKLRRKVLRFHRRSVDRDQYAAELAYLRHHRLDVFPYPFASAYRRSRQAVRYDRDAALPYVLFNGTKLYYPSDMTSREVQEYFGAVLREQDERSPHRYLTESFGVPSGAVVADVGAAEGIFALSVIGLAAHCYLFEPEPRWLVPLRRTFEPWMAKVTIVPQSVSDKVTPGVCTTIDSYFSALPLDFLKVDAEGEEPGILQQAVVSLENKITQAVVCCYHRQDHHAVLRAALLSHGFSVEDSAGFAVFGFDPELRPPYFRRMLVRARRVPGALPAQPRGQGG